MNGQKWMIFLLLAGLMSVLTACNTIEGAGRDIKSAGEAIEKAADRDDD